MEKNLSAILLNSHAPLTSTRPTVPGMIPVGGLHIKMKPDPLPKDIKEFIENAEDGVIYFSLGSNVKSSEMPIESRQIFLDVFSTLKQRVIWKFEDQNLPELPSNVMVKNWMPQPDILAHPNIKVFITHGGLFGTQEGVYNAVPMLGMPFYCDQVLIHIMFINLILIYRIFSAFKYEQSCEIRICNLNEVPRSDQRKLELFFT